MISVAVDVILISITGYTIVIGLLSFWFMIRMRLILRQQKEGAELLGHMVSSIYDSINDKERRIIDLMYRTDLLETTLRRQRVSIEAEGDWSKVSRSDVRRDVMLNITPGRSNKVSETEFRLLYSLAEKPLRVSEITRSMGKSREHTSRMLGKLVTKGLLERLSTEVGIMYALTDGGKAVVM